MARPKSDWFSQAPPTPTNAKADTPLFRYLIQLMRGENLSDDEASAFFAAMIDVNADPSQIAAVLTALTAKGETPEELAGMARVMRKAAIPIRAPKNAIDLVGTGSSACRTFNVSTAAAFVAAGAGLNVVKQSNRGVTSTIGSSEVLGELGIKVATDPIIGQASLGGTGLTFLFAPKFHPHLRRVGDVRRGIGIRTCLNLLGLMANPGAVRRQLVGVWHKTLVEPVARALSLLGSELAWVVHGEDGLDEVTLSGKTLVAAVRGDEVRPYVISPKDFGLREAPIEHLRVTSAKESALLIREVLSSKRRDEARSLVVLNAAAALIVGGLATEPMHAARLAEQSIDSGMAQNKLDRLIQVTNKRSAATNS
jgi:anthranilate phosphoribosyltransferase